MRTSVSQFEILISYMERYGDLSRPNDGPQGRLNNLKKWSELAGILNADGSGEHKSQEKWKKTWSDLKNNTKRKAAKINKAACGTGGGPAFRGTLTALEERVLSIINPTAVVGMEVPEVGLAQDIPDELPLVETPDEQSLEIPDENPTTPSILEPDYIVDYWDQPGTSQQHQFHSPPPVSPAKTDRRKRPGCALFQKTMKKRKLPQTQMEKATDFFLKSDKEWRSFLEEKERMAHKIEKERLRLREIELQQQARWQEICAQFLLVLENMSHVWAKKQNENE